MFSLERSQDSDPTLAVVSPIPTPEKSKPLVPDSDSSGVVRNRSKSSESFGVYKKRLWRSWNIVFVDISIVINGHTTSNELGDHFAPNATTHYYNGKPNNNKKNLIEQVTQALQKPKWNVWIIYCCRTGAKDKKCHPLPPSSHSLVSSPQDHRKRTRQTV